DVIVPPSVKSEGKRYEWLLSPELVELTEEPIEALMPVRDIRGQESQRRSVMDRELLIDVMQMDLDRSVREVELAADFLIRETRTYEAHDLTFALSQRARESCGLAACSIAMRV